MAIAEIIAAVISGGVIGQGLAYLRGRRALTVHESELYRQAIDHQLTQYRAMIDAQDKRIAEAEARANHAESQARTAESRATTAESQRDDLLKQSATLRREVDDLRRSLTLAVERITTIERERNEAQRELSRHADDIARELVKE